MSLIRKGTLGVLTAAVYAGAALPASALDFHLTSWNSALNGFGTDFGTVTVSLVDATHATVGFSTDTSKYAFFDSQIGDVNVNATSWSIGTFTSDPANKITDGGSQNADGFGKFNQTTDETAPTDPINSLGFTLTNKGGTWSNVADVLTPNNNGFSVAAHIGVWNPNKTGFVTTGYAGDGGGGGGGELVPEASTMALLGFGGLPVLFGAIRARKRR